MQTQGKAVNLLEGSISKGIIKFCFPLFLGQLLQQLYNIADAWVVGNFASNEAFAAVSSGGSLSFFIIGFFGGLGAGGGIIVSHYYGAADEENIKKSIHSNVLFALICSVAATIVGITLVPVLLRLMETPEDVLPYSLQYFNVYFGGITTIVMYNTLMSVMRSIGDSFHPLIYLLISSVLNIVLDLTFVAGLGWGVTGAAAATVISQGVSAVLCLLRLCRQEGCLKLEIKEIFKWHGSIMAEILRQGLPMGIQNSVISIGNMVVQKNINAFGSYAMSGLGAYSKVEGFVFLPINAISLSVPTFISQNLGARQYDRAKKGARFSILCGVVLAELIGFIFYFTAEPVLRFFVDSDQAIEYGLMQVGVTAFFYCLLAYSHCAAGVMRGAGKSIVPMITMLSFWCVFRVAYVTLAIQIRPVFTTICWAYPITWGCSTIVFTIWLLTQDWTHAFETQHEFLKNNKKA